MSRTAVGVTAGVLVASCVVAMLPAQEAVRKRPPTMRVYSDEAQGQSQAALLPVDDASVGLVPVDSTPGEAGSNLHQELHASGQQAAQEYAGPPPAFSATGNGPSPTTQRASEPPQLRSVLKTADASSIGTLPAGAVPSETTETGPMPNGAPPVASVYGPQPTAPASAPPPMSQSPGAPPPERSLPRRPPPRASVFSSGTTSHSSRPVAGGAQDLSLSGRAPMLRVDVAGPQGITLGKPAAYVIHLSNESDTPADEVIVRTSIPANVQVAGAQPTAGDTVAQSDGPGVTRLVWSVPRLAARARQSLRLDLVASEGEAFDLAIEWAARPVGLQAAIAIKRPELELALTGPAEMIFGEEKAFTLTVANPGTGDAEDVVVNIASGAAPAQSINVGQIPAGAKRELPLQIVASQPGLIELKATASAEGGLTAETVGNINVRKAELQITVDAPQLKFAGNEATYAVQVTNAGTATADEVQLAMSLPQQARYVDGIDGAVVAPGSVKWRIANLPPGAAKNYEVRLQLLAEGLNRLVVQAQAPSAGSAAAEAQTKVEAVSDLELAVDDPTGPVSTDEEAVYDLVVINRGTRAAEQVRIVMQFGEGIEPVAFEGCEARIVPGQILCQPLPELGAGEQVKIRIRAQAQNAGTHQFRVEVTAAGDDTRLVSEGTTRFFIDAGRSSSAARTAQRPTLVPSPAMPGTLR